MNITRVLRTAVASLLMTLSTSNPLSAQQASPTLTCTVPSTAIPGSFFIAQVTSNNSYTGSVMMNAQFPLVVHSSVMNGPPFNFTVDVPSSIVPGSYILTAYALAPGPPSISKCPYAQITITASSTITGLAVTPKTIQLMYTGDSTYLSVSGLAGTSRVPLGTSSELMFQSSNPAVATIASDGKIVALGVGQTSINITFRQFSATVNVQVLNSVRGDLNGDGQVDIDDINILTAYLNTSPTGPNDARDLNHDGVISALDARILTTLCTYPRCATHQ